MGNVKIKHSGTGNVGEVAEESLEFWLARGYVAAEDTAEDSTPAPAADDLSGTPVIDVTEPVVVVPGTKVTEIDNGTAAGSADTTSTQGRRNGRPSV